MALVVGIDIGTSGVRAMAVDERGHDHRRGARAPPCARSGSIRRSCRIRQLWWTATDEALSALLRPDRPVRACARARRRRHVGDDAGRRRRGPTRRRRPHVQRCGRGRSLRNGSPASLRARAPPMAPRPVSPRRSSSPAPGVARILHQADWVAGRLCGRFDLSDENNALKTGYDPVARAWPDWIGEAGLDRALLPTRRRAGNGHTAPSPAASASRYGFPDDAVVVAGTTDGCASFLATGADVPGDAVTALGTTLTLKLLSDVPIFSPEHGVYSHRLGERWLAGGASNSGGAALLRFFNARADRRAGAAHRPRRRHRPRLLSLAEARRAVPDRRPDARAAASRRDRRRR